jgi:hypothetical protein
MFENHTEPINSMKFSELLIFKTGGTHRYHCDSLIFTLNLNLLEADYLVLFFVGFLSPSRRISEQYLITPQYDSFLVHFLLNLYAYPPILFYYNNLVLDTASLSV